MAHHLKHRGKAPRPRALCFADINVGLFIFFIASKCRCFPSSIFLYLGLALVVAGVDHGHFLQHPHATYSLLAREFDSGYAAHLEKFISLCVKWTFPWWLAVNSQIRKSENEKSKGGIEDDKDLVPITVHIGARDLTWLVHDETHFMGPEKQLTRLVFHDAEKLAPREQTSTAFKNPLTPKEGSVKWTEAILSILFSLVVYPPIVFLYGIFEIFETLARH